MSVHVEQIARKIKVLERIHDLMEDALEGLSIELQQLRDEKNAKLQPELPLEEKANGANENLGAPSAGLADGKNDLQPIAYSLQPAPEDLCVCGHTFSKHFQAYVDGPGEFCFKNCGCNHFTPENKAGKPVGGAGPAR